MAEQQHNQQWQGHQQYPPQGYPTQPGPYNQAPNAQSYPPQGQAPQGYPPQGYAPPGQGYGYPPPGPPAQLQGQQAPQGYAQPGYSAPPGSQYQPPPAGGYYQPPPGQYAHPPQHQQQQWAQPPPGQYPPQGHVPQGYGPPPPAGYQQGYAPQHYAGPPAPPSLGYDEANQRPPQTDLSKDVEAIRKAMKGMGCDEKALVAVFTKISNPWTMQQLIKEYNSRFMRDLLKDVESETRGDFEEACLALLRTPLDQDVRTARKSLDRAGTDEEALMDVLLCRSNADVKIITAQYKKTNGRDLLAEIKDDVNDDLFRLYSMVLRAERAEEGAPVVPQDIDRHVTELQRATEGTIGVNAIAVAQIFTSCNDAQLRAIVTEYERKYHRKLVDVIEKEFTGDMEDALMRMIMFATDRAAADARLIHKPLNKTLRKDTLLINRLVRLYWDKSRMDAAKAAYRKKYNQSLASDIKEETKGDYEKILLGIIGEK